MYIDIIYIICLCKDRDMISIRILIFVCMKVYISPLLLCSKSVSAINEGAKEHSAICVFIIIIMSYILIPLFFSTLLFYSK